MSKRAPQRYAALMRAFARAWLLWALACCLTANAQNFTEVTGPFPGGSDGSGSWGDYNRDGYLDAWVVGANATGVVAHLYRNLSGTNFVASPAVLPGFNTGTATWGDYDNDGYLDGLMGGNSHSKCR